MSAAPRDLVERIDATRLLVSLLRERDETWDALAALLAPGSDLPPRMSGPHLALARLAAGCSLFLDLLPALDDAVQGQPLAPAERLSLGWWVRSTGEAVLGAAVSHNMPAPPTLERPQPGLDLDDRLRDLPLLALAADVARSQPAGTLEVRAGLSRGIAGCYRRTATGGQISLALDDLRPEAVGHVFAHELAHALDPDFCGDDREAFAYYLAPLLLEHQPATVDEAAPLVAATVRAIGRTAPGSTNNALAEYLQDLRAWESMTFAALATEPSGAGS